MTRVHRILPLVLGSLVAWSSAWAQDLPNDETSRDEFEIQERLDPEFKAIEGDGQDLLWDYGAFWRSSFLNFRSRQDNWIGVWNHQMRAWGRITFRKDWELYLRFKTSRTNFRSGDTPSGDHHRRDKPKLDLGFVAWGAPSTTRARVQLGRYYMSAGQGLVLAKRLDGIRADVRPKDWRLVGFVGRNPQSDNHPNPAFPGGSKSEFRFSGLEVEYLGLSRHRPYAGQVMVRDLSKERPINLNQDFEMNFDIAYVGVRGQIDADTKYFIENVHERGEVSNFGFRDNNYDRVESDAFLVGIQRILGDGDGLFELDYKQAEGDRSRTSVLSVGTASANSDGRYDRNFFYFGYTDTGLLYSPRLSNLKQWHAAVTWVQPGYEKHEFKVDWFKYYKRRESAPVSDNTATRPQTDLGTEWDLSWQYRVFSNAAFQTRWAAFLPGDAYFLRKPRQMWRFDFYLDF